MGTSTQIGTERQRHPLINELTTDEERAGLLEAFQEKGNEGLVNALEKMKSKGRMAVTGTLGYDVAYAKIFPQPDGSTVLRMVTDRPLLFGEKWASTRSADYELAGVEIVIGKDKKAKSGHALPCCSAQAKQKERSGIAALPESLEPRQYHEALGFAGLQVVS